MLKKTIYSYLSSMLFLGIIWCLSYCVVFADNHRASLQRGAKIFMNYCSGCHSLKYMRYNQMAEGLDLKRSDDAIDEDLLKNNLMFTQALVTDVIHIALPSEDAKKWFGLVPPDLSLIVREKGEQWLYQYMQNFYKDDSRPFGTNNLLVPGVAMPNILSPLIGEQDLISNKEAKHLSLIKKGDLTQAEITSLLHDLINFLAFVSTPELKLRHHLGLFVIGFLFILLLFAMSLKKVFWREIP